MADDLTVDFLSGRLDHPIDVELHHPSTIDTPGGDDANRGRLLHDLEILACGDLR
jgi:hypothetical protein